MSDGRPDHLARCFRAGEERLTITERAPSPPPGTPGVILQVHGLSAGYGKDPVLRGIDLTIGRGECVALLGESGSGKTTLARCIAGLHPRYLGEVMLDGQPLPHSSFARAVQQRRRIQYVFQNPYESLNPRKTVRDLVLGPARVLVGQIHDPDQLVSTALEQAALDPRLSGRYPDQLSGGERQRVAIARALAARPDVLVCDEVTSALDVSVQASIVELLAQLQQHMGLTLLFVTHDIALARNVAQAIAVLELGRIVEYGPAADVLAAPQHRYTQALVADTPHFQLAGAARPALANGDAS